jgi:DNA-binding MarR family transcriptional regulator
MSGNSGSKVRIVPKAAERTPAPADDLPYREVHSPTGQRFVDIVDEVMRLNGRLRSAGRMTTAMAGLRPSYAILLSSIGCASEPPTVPRIARALGQSRQSVQRTADYLVAEGYAEWIRNPDHRRAHRLVPTQMGRVTYARANSETAVWADRLVNGLAIDDLDTAITLLREIRRRLEDDVRP